jgi:hypothetical protein
MGRDALVNLHRIGQLKSEPRNVQEFDRLLKMASMRLLDAHLTNLSNEGRFNSAYSAAHAAALAALRWHGYRSENRFTVFQCLAHTLGWPPINGAFWMLRTKNGTWPNTKAIGTSQRAPSRKFATCCPI